MSSETSSMSQSVAESIPSARGSEEEKERHNPDFCSECNTDEFLVTEHSETYCKECGVVTSGEPLDRSRRWVDSRSGRERERGAPTTLRLYDKGLSTDIGYYRDGNGHWLSNKTRRRFSRLRKWDSRSKTPSKRQRSLREGLVEIARLVSALELGDSIHDRAVAVYREAWSNDFLPGRSIEAIATGSLYAACRLERLPRHLEEIAAVARVDEDDVKGAYKTLNRDLHLATPPPLPQDFVPGIASAVDASDRVEHRTHQLVRQSEIGALANGRSPSSIAAACLYHSSLHGDQDTTLTQESLAEAAYTSTTTLRNVWLDIQELDDNGELPE
ncbi:Transcription factor TFIIB cyclin-related protein [Halosimplex carlsbadense 2-9-1]|uniref:Transcription initiation factor IIB n=2 Tax=Halosimplex carlsbadense TaxID=171164 RepID=M0CAT7_9EURY|nr:Transcription factor TFIIB cyclin-related protein [Halosimplex carlsbadense 2-9-1]